MRTNLVYFKTTPQTGCGALHMIKSKTAYLLTAQALTKKKRSYLWTFTQREAIDYEAFRKAWNRLLTYLKRALPEWGGIRVYEVHPGPGCGAPEGFSHGLHAHVLCNSFFDVRIVRAVANKAGWGRVHVAKASKGKGEYLAKYLDKKRPPALKGWRLWAPFGNIDRTRVSDVEVDSFYARVWRWLAKGEEWDSLNYHQKCTRARQTWWLWGVNGYDTDAEGIKQGPALTSGSKAKAYRLRSRFRDLGKSSAPIDPEDDYKHHPSEGKEQVF